MSSIKNFVINGQKYYTYNHITLLELLQYFNYTTSLFVLEYNDTVCSKNEWNKILITNNDKIEIVTIVGGG